MKPLLNLIEIFSTFGTRHLRNVATTRLNYWKILHWPSKIHRQKPLLNYVSLMHLIYYKLYLYNYSYFFEILYLCSYVYV